MAVQTNGLHVEVIFETLLCHTTNPEAQSLKELKRQGLLDYYVHRINEIVEKGRKVTPLLVLIS